MSETSPHHRQEVVPVNSIDLSLFRLQCYENSPNSPTRFHEEPEKKQLNESTLLRVHQFLNFENREKSFFRADGEVAADSSGNTVFEYIPPEYIDLSIEYWIEAANRVSYSTSLLEITRIYQNYIVIHPFTDANGRSSRVILDYLMAKAGFPPVAHTLDTRDHNMFLPPEIWASEILKAWEKDNK